MSEPVSISDLTDEESVTAALAKAQAEIDAFKATLQADQDAIKARKAAAQELLKAARAEEAEAAKIASSIFDAQVALRRMERNTALIAQQAERLKAQARFNAQLTMQQEIFADMVKDKPWRERALPHQMVGMYHLASAGRAILADAPRFGKTLTILGTCDMLDAKRVLFLTKTTIVGEIEAQVKRWSPDRALIFNLTGKTKIERNAALDIIQLVPECIVVMSYDAWSRDKSLIERLVDSRFDTVIIDEAHEINNTTTSRFKGVKRIVTAPNQPGTPVPCSHCNEPVVYGDAKTLVIDWVDMKGNSQCVLNEQWPNNHKANPCSVRNVFPMTGTVIVNKPQDLFALLNLVDPAAFPDLYAYERTYLENDWQNPGKWVFKPGGLDRLTKKLADKYLRRDRNNSPEIDLPEPTLVIRNLELTREAYPRQYKVCEDLNKAILDIAEDHKIGIDYAIVLIMRKRQAVTWPCFTMTDYDGEPITFNAEESIKIDEVIRFENGKRNEWEGMIPELTAAGEKVALASQFKGPLREISRRLTLAGIKHITIDGDTPISQRNAMVDDFNNPDSDVMVCLGNYKAMGTGITLGGANEMIILDEEWSAAKNDQMYDRIVVMGKEQKCQVTILRVPDSIDTWMASLIERKRNMTDGFNDATDIAADLLASIKKGLL